MKDRITKEDLEYWESHVRECKAERMEPERDKDGNIVYEYGEIKYRPARLHIQTPGNIARALSFSPVRIFTLRRALAFSQAEMAQRLGVNVRSYRAWELGDVLPSDANIRSLLVLEHSEEPRTVITPGMIQQLREMYHYSKNKFAKAYEVTPATVARWESGESTPRPKQARMLSEDWQTAVNTGLIPPEQK